MKPKLCFVAFGLSLLVGCSATARLYPVQGPLMSQSPVPVFTGKLTGIVNEGSVSFLLANGEVCKGQWTRVAPVKSSQGAQSIPAPASTDMPAIWDQIYGPGYYTAHVLGTSLHAQAVITGTSGTVLTVEFYRPDAVPQELGVAKDSHGNIYKMTFNTAPDAVAWAQSGREILWKRRGTSDRAVFQLCVGFRVTRRGLRRPVFGFRYRRLSR